MNASVRLPFDSKRTALTMAAVCVLTALFAWLQNSTGWVGGPISLPKALWLNYALLVFFVVPFCASRNAASSETARRLFGWVFASFVVRGAIELWILYFTRDWKCVYGITHDLFTFGMIAWLRPGLEAINERRPASLVQTALLVEAFMAWQFSLLASPAAGIYFAADTPHFQFVNAASWMAVAIGYPALGILLWKRA